MNLRTAFRAMTAIVAGVVLSAGTNTSPAAARPRPLPSPPTLRVGTQNLKLCAGMPDTYCGRLAVPLDYADPGGPTIEIAFRWYPATDPPGGLASGTVVPVEGGPGFGSIGSVGGGYRVMYGPLLDRWNMLAVDLRGTGASTPLDCPELQDFSGQASGPLFDAAVGRCADRLNHRWKSPTGAFVHASDLFTSAPAAEDVASVLRALDISEIDLYGDSYGSFFAQVFARRYPELIRSVVLDSTYATDGLDPWYRSSIAAMPAAFDAVCSRSRACAQAEPGPSWDRIEALAARLRTSPVTAEVPGPDGTRQTVTMGVVGLVDLINDAAGDPFVYRGLDAAIRSFLTSGDPDALLRLYDQRLAFDEDYFGIPARAYSGELYLAVSCLDYPQLFDMAADGAARSSQLHAAESELPDTTFAPFTTEEWIAQDQNTEAYTACVAWPPPLGAQPPLTDQPPLPTSIPVLILGGELDTWTPASGVPQVVSQIGGDSRFVELANSTHVVGEGDTTCGSDLVRAFVDDPGAVDSMDASCAVTVPAIHAVGVYAESLANVPPLVGAASNSGPVRLLRLGSAAVATAGDALARFQATEGRVDHGLHGGTTRASASGRTITLVRDALVPGVAVSGTVTTSPTEVMATLTTSTPGSSPARFTVRWPLGVDDATAEVTGTSDGRKVVGTTEAP